MKHRLSKKCKEQPPIIFHAIKESDLEKIIQLKENSNDSECYFLAPSIGITKLDDVKTKFGDIVFVGDPGILDYNEYEVKVFDNDVYTSTFLPSSEGLYSYQPNAFAEEIKEDFFYEFETFADDVIYSVGNITPYFIKRHMDINDFDYQIYEILEDNIELTQKYCKYYASEYQFPDCDHLEEDYDNLKSVIEKITSRITKDFVENSIIQVPFTRQYIEDWFMRENKDMELKGKEGFGSDRLKVILAREFVLEDRDTLEYDLHAITKQHLTCDPIDYNKIEQDQDEKIHYIDDYIKDNDRAYDIIRNAFSFGTNIVSFSSHLCQWVDCDAFETEVMPLNKYRLEILHSFYDIPKEYYEGKTIQSIPLNAFKKVYIPNTLGMEVTSKLINMCKFNKDIISYTYEKEIK